MTDKHTDPAKMTDAELTRLVAVDVMGYTLIHGIDGVPGFCFDNAPHGEWVFRPLTEPRDRDMVVDAMRARGYRFEMYCGPTKYKEPCLVVFEHAVLDVDTHAEADTPGRAVCVAAVRARLKDMET